MSFFGIFLYLPQWRLDLFLLLDGEIEVGSITFLPLLTKNPNVPTNKRTIQEPRPLNCTLSLFKRTERHGESGTLQLRGEGLLEIA